MMVTEVFFLRGAKHNRKERELVSRVEPEDERSHHGVNCAKRSSGVFRRHRPGN